MKSWKGTAKLISQRGWEKKGLYLESLVKTINNIRIPFSIWEKQNPDRKGSRPYNWTSLIGSYKQKLMDFLSAQLRKNGIPFPWNKRYCYSAVVWFQPCIQNHNWSKHKGWTVTWYLTKINKPVDCSLANKRIKYGNDSHTLHSFISQPCTTCHQNIFIT